jgi:hypothetical protein
LNPSITDVPPAITTFLKRPSLTSASHFITAKCIVLCTPSELFESSDGKNRDSADHKRSSVPI